MKKQLSKSLLGLALFSALSGFAQHPMEPCDTYGAMDDAFAKIPGARQAYEIRQAEFQNHMANPPAATAKGAAVTEYTIPVVFHILHTGGSENITDAAIAAAIDWVNKDLARLHSDTNTIAHPFREMYIPSDIKLVLAKKDKNGNCITGIYHKYDTRTIWDRNAVNFPATYYAGITTNTPTDKYLNVIIVKEILSQGNQAGIVVGYTYLPATWGTGADQDCIVYRYDFLANGGARSLTHELGHWLNLDHTFGQTNNPGSGCGDDQVCDTPPLTGCLNINCCPSSVSGNTCSSVPHTAGSSHTHTYSAASCTYAAGTSNTENIMNYVTCNKNFTRGQTYRMQSTLEYTAKRKSLWQSTNLTATDINGVIPCAPVAEFLSSTNLYTVCSGGSLLMNDFSYNGAITSWDWAADNGAIIAAPTVSNTSITFPNVGLVNVSFTVTNGQGSSTKTRTVKVIDGTPGMIAPAMEGFEAATIPSNWLIYNGNNGSAKFDRTTAAVPYEGTACLQLNTATSGPNHEDYLQTPIIDMTGGTGSFQFAYAYARQSTNHNDKLRVEASNDCGGSYTTILELASNQMALNSGEVQSQEWYPMFAFEWKTVDLNTYPGLAAKWTPFKSSPYLTIRFRFIQGTVGAGNNFFLDAINLPGSTVGMNELRKETKLNIYPNPASGEAKIEFKLNDASIVKVMVLDILGKEVQSIPATTFNPGSHNLTINGQQNLPAGVYNVNVSINGVNLASKLIIK